MILDPGFTAKFERTTVLQRRAIVFGEVCVVTLLMKINSGHVVVLRVAVVRERLERPRGVSTGYCRGVCGRLVLSTGREFAG